MNLKKLIISIIITLLLGFIEYYFMLPSIDIHNISSWMFIINIIIIFLVIYGFINIRNLQVPKTVSKKGLLVFLPFIIAILVIIINSPLFMSKRYYERITITNSDFKEDIPEVNFNTLALLDRDSSTKLGDRVMGQMSELVSQFYVSDMYTQINYNDDILRVTPLEYYDMIKYFTNHSTGIKGYITVNSVNGESKLVKLEKGMKYSPSALFFEDVNRYLRFKYPLCSFGDLNFEIDNEGNPYWIMQVISYHGLSQRRDVSSIITLNAITGETHKYDVSEVPTWVDHVYDADLIIEQVNDWGAYKNGYFNTIFGQKEMTMTTTGYNYLAMNDDVYLYTGITSVVSDESNLGFILTNLRTKETKYYDCPGAEEYSAMDSAMGQVQQMDYVASFPLLINLDNRPTYLISLKDNAGLVKMYAFVDVADYQKVVVTDSSLGIVKASENYIKNNGYTKKGNEIKITIKEITSVIIDGNTYYYLVDREDGHYRVSIKVNSDILPFIKTGETYIVNYINNNSIKEIIDIKSVA